MFSLIGIIRLIPFTKGMRNTIIIRSVICLSNIASVLLLSQKIHIVSLVIIFITVLYTEAYEFLKNYLAGHFIKLIKSNSFLLKVNLILSFNIHAYGFLEMAKAEKAFHLDDDDKAEKILISFSNKVHKDLNWISNCLIYLINTGRGHLAYSILQTTSIDLQKENIPYNFLQIAIQIYCDNSEFFLAEIFLEYMEIHYYDAQHKYMNLRSFLYYAAGSGNKPLYDKILTKFPEIRKSSSLRFFDEIHSSDNPLKSSGKEPKSYVFNLASPVKGEIYPLYIFAGIICLVTFLQLLFSTGGTTGERILSGRIYPIEYIKFGALVRDLVWNGDWIRLLTPLFLHAGLLHLSLNIFGLINIGRVLMRFIDKYILLFIFAGGAVTGNLLSLFFSKASLSVGASGGVFSILGALFVYLLWHKREINRMTFNRILINFAVILAIQILFGLQNSNIDNFAHIGGFLGGVILTVLSLLILEKNFQKYYLIFIKILLFSLSVKVLYFWFTIVSGGTLYHIPLTESIDAPPIEYSIPEYWEEDNDRFYDQLSGAQIIMRGYKGIYNKDQQIGTIIEMYGKEDNFLFKDRRDIDKDWSIVTFDSKNESSHYSLYYFCANIGNNFVEAYLFLDPALFDDYLVIFASVLQSVR